jgi:hypothetical protein
VLHPPMLRMLHPEMIAGALASVASVPSNATRATGRENDCRRNLPTANLNSSLKSRTPLHCPMTLRKLDKRGALNERRGGHSLWL